MDVRVISERLKSAREALGLSQQALAEKAGISLRSQQNYEAGNRIPDAEYLSFLADLGADVLYILTGNRNPAILQQPVLSPRKAALLNNYDNTSEEGKKIIEATAFAAAKPKAQKMKKDAA